MGNGLRGRLGVHVRSAGAPTGPSVAIVRKHGWFTLRGSNTVRDNKGLGIGFMRVSYLQVHLLPAR